MPVMNVDQATGLCGGFDVCSGMKPPVDASRDKFGTTPSCMYCASSFGSMPSTPRITIRAGPFAPADALQV
jgi:hypothetical protein